MGAIVGLGLSTGSVTMNLSLYWIGGKPGAGKSTLVKFTHGFDSPLKYISEVGKFEAIKISFFFHELGIPSKKTFSGLLHALLSQLLDQLPELIPLVPTLPFAEEKIYAFS